MRLNSQRGNSFRRWRVFIPVLMITFAGCSGGSRPPTIPVQGKITYKGQPVTQGMVTFQAVKPAEGYPQRPATGTINPDGTYQLATFEAGDGVIPGEYKVAVVSKTGEDTLDNPNAVAKWLIPEKYGTADKSGLTATISPDDSPPKVIDFELTD